MLAIGRALMAKPKLLMLDEPGLGLAPKLVETVLDTTKQINDQGTTILLVEQNARAALSMADRAYVLEVGNIVLEGTGRELLQNEGVQKAYLGGAARKVCAT
jgi:branched-chain amino acid transport system ATP-binding protein